MVAQVHFFLALDRPLSYRIDADLAPYVEIGKRVIAPVGNKLRMGIVFELEHTENPELKSIRWVDGSEIQFTPIQLYLWQQMADFYFCTVGEVIKASIPSVFRDMNKMYFYPINNDEEKKIDFSTLEKTSFKVLNFGYKTQSEYDKSKDEFWELNPEYDFSKIRSEKQKSVLSYIEKLPYGFNFEQHSAKIDTPSFRTLQKKEALVVVKKKLLDKALLNVHQEKAYKKLKINLLEKKEALIFGVTGSGKTHLYHQLIYDEIKQNSKAVVLILLPEIAITQQLILRFRKMLGNIPLYAYHSKTSWGMKQNLLYKLYHKKDDSPTVILGARSAILIPYKRLDLLILDEVHEQNFKQTEKSPRYYALEIAKWHRKKNNTKVVYGSATPNIELYKEAVEENWQVYLKHRHGGSSLPKIDLVKRKTNLIEGIFTPTLKDAISETLEQKKQLILFHNRRGYTPIVRCKNLACQEPIRCHHCDVTMTYHKFRQKLVCHYCQTTQPLTVLCTHCGQSDWDKEQGFGTQKIEEKVLKLFPEARVKRVDTDLINSKAKLDDLVAKMTNYEIDILIGTQMIAKGFDFPKVTLVGVLDVDSMLQMPNFRAKERAYQQLTQVAGRSGRAKAKGRVLIQTRNIDDITLQQVLGSDYSALFFTELRERKEYRFPPYVRMVDIHLESMEEALLEQGANYLAKLFRVKANFEWFGPITPPIAKIKSTYQRQFNLKLSTQKTEYLHQNKLVHQVMNWYSQHFKTSKVKWTVNVNPQ